MSTRSTIAIEHANGTIKKVYCHYDGYVRHVGKCLAEHYSLRHHWNDLCYGNDIRGFELQDNGMVCTVQRFDRPEDSPMFPDVYPDYAAYRASIDHLFHEYNYILRKNNKMEVIYGDHKNPDRAKPKSLKRCLGRLKAKKSLETKNSMSK
jgi:hypothetical protein